MVIATDLVTEVMAVTPRSGVVVVGARNVGARGPVWYRSVAPPGQRQGHHSRSRGSVASEQLFARWQVRRHRSSPSTWCTAPPVVNASAGTARLVDTKGNQYVRQRHQIQPNRTAGREGAHRGGVGANCGCGRAGRSQNFPAYSGRTAVNSRFDPVTVGQSEWASDQRFRWSETL